MFRIVLLRHHHEFFNDKGYPDGLKGYDIPISAAILSVADAWDAMTSDRPYRKAMKTNIAIDEIKRSIGTQFNPVVAKAFLELYDRNNF